MPRITRRHFLQIAGSGLLVAHSPYLLAQPPKKKLGVALLGLGNYSTNLLAPTTTCESISATSRCLTNTKNDHFSLQVRIFNCFIKCVTT